MVLFLKNNPTITFSHRYPKLHGQESATLLAIRLLDAEDVQKNPTLIEYDTKYYENPYGYYPLPKKGKLLQLIFVGNKQVPFCTMRRHTPEKEKYYAGLVGRTFDIIIGETK